VPKPFFDLEAIDPDGLRRIAGLLKEIGFTEQGVRERLGLEDVSLIQLSAYPYYVRHCLRRRSRIDVAIHLFLLQGIVTEEELGTIFDTQARKVLRSANLLQGSRSTRTFRARVSLYPIADRLFFTDHRFAHDPWVKSRMPRSPVMYLGADSYYLARTTLRRPNRSTLDLCSGSGVHTVLAAGSAERAVGVDISPRSVNFGRLNAMLNDAWNAVFLEGDLFTPVGGERFDLVLANPPFVPSPTYQLAYRDGGPSGADVLRRIIAALPDYLTSTGVAQIVTHLAERSGESYLDRTRRWLGGANMNLHSLRVGEEDIVDYSTAQVKRTFGENYARYDAQLAEWVTNLRSQRFKRILAVVLTFQWNEDAPNPPWTQEDEGKPPRTNIARDVARILAAKKSARRLPSLATLDTMRAGVPDDLILIERRRTTGRGFETKDFRVKFNQSVLSPELDIKPLVRDLLERVDNRSTVPEVIARLATDTGQAVGEIDERCRRAFVIMFERGLVTLDEVSGSSKASEVKEISVSPMSTAITDAVSVDPFAHSSDDGELELPAGKGKPAGESSVGIPARPDTDHD